MPQGHCQKHDQLASEAHEILKKLHELTRRQLEAFEGGEDERFMKLDRELELTVGEKERHIGALRDHDEEHGCQR